jgi:hypothetical protein
MNLASTIVAGTLVGILAGCTTAGTQPSAANTTLLPGSERSFTVTYTAEPERDGQRQLRGYVASQLGEAVQRVQLLALAVDSSGNVVAQRLAWLPGTIPALGRASFDIPKMPPAAEYRVTVWAYDRLKGGGGA